MIVVGDIVDILSGYAFKSSLFNNNGDGLPLVRIRDVGKKKSQTFYPGEFKNEHLLQNGDFIVGMDGDFRLAVWEGGKALLNQRVCKITPKEEKVNSKYLYYILPKELKRIEDRTSFATVKHLSVKGIKSIKIPLPSLPEQKKIAEILDVADNLRQKDQQLIEHYNTLSQSLFLDMFGDPVTNQMGWEKVEFSTVGSLDRGKSKHRPRNAPELLGGSHPLIQTGNVANCGGYIREYQSTYSDFGLKQSKKWSAGTLCITIAANIAKTGILTFDACFPDSIVGFSSNKKSNIEFVRFWLSFLQKILEDTAPMAAQKNINLKILRELEIPLPPIDLQNKFSERIKEIEKQKQHAQSSLKKSDDLFNSLLQKAFKGELSH